MAEEEAKELEYTIECHYRMIVEEPTTYEVTVMAKDEEAAVEKAWEAVYALECVDEDCVEEDETVVLNVRDVSIRGSGDDQTLNLFPDFPRGTKGGVNARP